MKLALRLFECQACLTAAKLPYSNDSTAWCEHCRRITLHTIKAEHLVSENVEARMQRFLATMRCAPAAPPGTVPQRDIAQKLRSAGYPSRHVEGIRGMAGRALEVAEKLQTFRRRDSHYALYGGNGTGKTQIAARIAWYRADASGSPGRYITAPDLAGRLKAAMDTGTPADEILRPLRVTSFLVVDEAQDIGTTDRGAAWLLEALRNIADVRYREFRPMLWLLNADSPAEVIQRLGARIVDRINETGGLVHCNWQSYRDAAMWCEDQSQRVERAIFRALDDEANANRHSQH